MGTSTVHKCCFPLRHSALLVILLYGAMVCQAQEQSSFAVDGLDQPVLADLSNTNNNEEEMEKRSGGRSFQPSQDWADLDAEKRAGGRAFQSLAENKRGGGRAFQLAGGEKRGGGRTFSAFTDDFMADKRGGGRAFVAQEDKRAGARAFQMPSEEKRAGGRAFQLVDAKRAGGRSFQYAGPTDFQFDKRAGGRHFFPIVSQAIAGDKRGGARAFVPDEEKRGGARAFQAWADEKRGGGRNFQVNEEKRAGGRMFVPFQQDPFMTEKRAGARPFFGDMGLKRAGGRYFSRHFYDGLSQGGFGGYGKRAGARPMLSSMHNKRAGGRAFFGDSFADSFGPFYSRRFYPEYMKKAPYLFEDENSNLSSTSAKMNSNNFISELKRTQGPEDPSFWMEDDKRAGGRTFPIGDEDSKEKRMLDEVARYR